MTWLLAARAFLSRVPWQVYIALALAAVWYFERDSYGDRREEEGRAEVIAKYERAERQWAKELADASIRYEALAQSLRADERRDRETIREIYRNVQVPTNCAVPDAAVRVLDNAVARANAAATGQSGGTMP